MNEPGNTSSQLSPPVQRWLGRIREPIAPVVLLGGSCNGLSFARSLGRRRVPVLMLETLPLLGIHTRFADVLMLPDVRREPELWLQLLESIGRRLKQPAVMFSTSDGHSQLIAHNADMLGKYFRFLIPDADTLDRIHNKRLQYGIAVQEGVPIPTVQYPESVEDVRSIIPRLSFPALLKPYDSDASRGRLKQKLLVVTSGDELIAAYEEVKAMNLPVMIQEMVPGEDSQLYGYMGFWDREGNERAWITKQKLRQNPPGFGDGSLQTTIHAPQVAEHTRCLLKALKYRGFVGTEFKLDPRDGTFRLMEINARTVSGNQMPVSAGVDLPWIGYQYLCGVELPREPITHGRRLVKYLNEEWDVQSFMALRRESKLTFATWLRSIRDAKALAIWASDDPRPFLMGLVRTLTLLNPPSVPILTFHVIGSGEEPIYYPVDAFRRALSRLREQGFSTIRVSDLARIMRVGLPLPSKTVALTFDDGDRSVYEVAWPILREFDMTATVFMLADPSQKFEGRGLLSWEQAREMQQGGIEIGAHSVTHRDLRGLEPDQVEDELSRSRRIIEDALGTGISSFAYPFGHYDESVVEMTRSHFACACTVDLGLVQRGADLHALKRVDAHYIRTARTFDLIFKPSFRWYLKARDVPRRLRRAVGA